VSAQEAVPILAEWASAADFPGDLAASVCYAESGFDLWQTRGDSGVSVGGISVHLPAHGGPAEKWLGPDGLRRSLALMGSRWLAALTTHGRTGWEQAPSIEARAQFFRRWWPDAQGADASQITIRQCRDAVQAGAAAWNQFGATQESTSMVLRPTIIQWPADGRNINARPAGVVYEGLVCHTSGGSSTIEQLGAWFGGLNQAEGKPGSTHFGVDRTGRIGQFVQLHQQPIAHGAEAASTAKILKGNEGISTNAYLIGVEHLDAGVPGSVTEVQLEASAWLMAWLWETEIAPHAARTGAVLDLDHLIQHSDLAPVSKPLCASWPKARMAQHLARIKARLAGESVPDLRDARIRHLEAGLRLAQQGLDDLAARVAAQRDGIERVLTG
jgi:hypothetical protein